MSGSYGCAMRQRRWRLACRTRLNVAVSVFGFALELLKLLKQRDGDLLDGSTGFFDGGEPPVEVVGPVDQHDPEYNPKRLQLASCSAGTIADAVKIWSTRPAWTSADRHG
jgi:hypothetical protein